jgi:hypothetical protein
MPGEDESGGRVPRRGRAWQGALPLPRGILRQRRNEARAFLFAFDLLELDGVDMRREPIEVRKRLSPASFARAGQGCG